MKLRNMFAILLVSFVLDGITMPVQGIQLTRIGSAEPIQDDRGIIADTNQDGIWELIVPIQEEIHHGDFIGIRFFVFEEGNPDLVMVHEYPNFVLLVQFE